MTCGPKQGSPPERDARAEPHNPHDFLLRRDSLAWARWPAAQNKGSPLEREARAEPSLSLYYFRLGDPCSLERE